MSRAHEGILERAEKAWLSIEEKLIEQGFVPGNGDKADFISGYIVGFDDGVAAEAERIGVVTGVHFNTGSIIRGPVTITDTSGESTTYTYISGTGMSKRGGV